MPRLCPMLPAAPILLAAQVVLAALGVIVVPAAASAQATPGLPCSRLAIDSAAAISIAAMEGLVTIDRLGCASDDSWLVAGKDRRGRPITVAVDARTGRVLHVERDG